VTNDWFSGLIPAYVREENFFGKIFEKTKTFHIAHNLDETYEGRLYPKSEAEGSFYWINKLPGHLLVDELWQKKIVNPSRCAFMRCDNWGTVSHSYKF
jgi:starch synthase